jgi:hypothetical protein
MLILLISSEEITNQMCGFGTENGGGLYSFGFGVCWSQMPTNAIAMFVICIEFPRI